MLTTLTQRNLIDTTIKYKFINGELTLIIETNAAHNTFGEVNVTLSNCAAINIYTSTENLVTDYFNNSFLFNATTLNRLECSLKVTNGIEPTGEEIELPNNGTDIVAQIDNLEFFIPLGVYLINLLDSSSTSFDGAKVSFQEQNIINIDGNQFNGLADVFDDGSDQVNYQSVDNQELTFCSTCKISVVDNSSGTNIPLFCTRE